MVEAFLAIVIIMFCIGFAVIVHRLQELHMSMNSRLDELLKTTGTLARAEGFKAGQEDHLNALKDAGSKLGEK